MNTYNINYLNYEADDIVLEGYYDVTWQLRPCLTKAHTS